MKILIKYFSILILLINTYGDLAPVTAPKLNVVATDSIIGDWLQNIAADSINLITLVGPDTDNHTFEPASKDAMAIAKADIIFENGLGLERWLNLLYKSSNSKAKRIPLSSYIKNLLKADCHGHSHCNHGHDYDPHTWLSVKNVIIMVQAITDTLIQKDPNNTQNYKALSSKYITELNALDAWIFEEVKKIPPANRKLITNHNSFAYFANRYDFTILGDILGSTSTDSVDPSASHFKNLLKIIQKNKVPAIFGENIQNNALINNLAQEAHLPHPKVLYTEALSKKDGPAKNYIELMKYNVHTLVESLQK